MKKLKVIKDSEISFELTADEVQEAILRYAGFKAASRDGSRKANQVVSFELTEDGGAVGSYK